MKRRSEMPVSAGMNRGERFVTLDALRCLAVVMVLGRHRPQPPMGWPVLDRFGEIWYHGGWMGVDLFFVLSGFLIGKLLLIEYRDSGRIDVARFLVRRGFKIYPAYYTMIAATIFMRSQFLQGTTWRQYVPELTFTQNYLGGVWNHTWSLAVEEHFYLFFAFGLAALGPRGFAGAAVLICLASPVLRWLACGERVDIGLILFPSHLRMDSLLLGVGAAYLQIFHLRALRVRRSLSWAALILATIPFIACGALGLWSRHTLSWGLTGLSLASAGSVLALVHLERDLRNVAVVRWLAFIGSHSYSIYLWHMPFQKWCLNWKAYMWRHVDLAPAPAFLVYLVGSIVVGVISSYAIERTFLRIRECCAPAKSSREAVVFD